jgi:hypothetical protein
MHKIGRQFRQSVKQSIRPSKFDRYVFALYKTSVKEPSTECRHKVDSWLRASGMQEADQR